MVSPKVEIGENRMCAVCFSLYYHKLSSMLKSHQSIHFVLVLTISCCSSLRAISPKYPYSRILDSFFK